MLLSPGPNLSEKQERKGRTPDIEGRKFREELQKQTEFWGLLVA